jgi:hypothetical protein
MGLVISKNKMTKNENFDEQISQIEKRVIKPSDLYREESVELMIKIDRKVYNSFMCERI